MFLYNSMQTPQHDLHNQLSMALHYLMVVVGWIQVTPLLDMFRVLGARVPRFYASVWRVRIGFAAWVTP